MFRGNWVFSYMIWLQRKEEGQARETFISSSFIEEPPILLTYLYVHLNTTETIRGFAIFFKVLCHRLKCCRRHQIQKVASLIPIPPSQSYLKKNIAPNFGRCFPSPPLFATCTITQWGLKPMLLSQFLSPSISQRTRSREVDPVRES